MVRSYRPREMVTVNADGFGAALWLDEGEDVGEPAVCRTALPVWADPILGFLTSFRESRQREQPQEWRCAAAPAPRPLGERG